MDAKPRVAQHVGNRPRLLLVGETRSVGTRATELRSKMTADKNPSAQSKQNSASRNLRFTALGVVLACAVICAYSALTPGVELKWSAQRSLQLAGWNSQHTVYVARSATGYESGPEMQQDVVRRRSTPPFPPR